MDKEIEELKYQTNKMEARFLLRLAELLDNGMDPCDCDNEKVYHFNNILPKNENTSFCLNCGGFVEDGE